MNGIKLTEKKPIGKCDICGDALYADDDYVRNKVNSDLIACEWCFQKVLADERFVMMAAGIACKRDIQHDDLFNDC